MTERALKRLISRLALMPFFPAKDEDRDAIGEIILEFAETDEQLEWLGKRMLELYQQWPGPRELRACFCARYRPKDGKSICSAVYAEQDGIPSEHPSAQLQIGPGKPLRSEPVTEDAEMAAKVAKLAQLMALRPGSRQRRRMTLELKQSLTEQAGPNPDSGSLKQNDPRAITQADIDRAVAENRERRDKGIVESWREHESNA